MQQEHAELSQVSSEMSSLKNETDALHRQNEQSQLALDKAIFDIERKYQGEIQ